VNLLQPQDRRSATPGDDEAAVGARARLNAAGIGRGVIDAVAGRVGALSLGVEPVVVDLGAGTGDLLAAVAGTRPMCCVGLDISVAAVRHAARHHNGPTWVVANADRRLPLVDGSVDVVVSVHARRNPTECARVLRPGGWLLIAVPAPDDLIELRAEVQGAGIERDRTAAVVAEHLPWFAVADRGTSRVRASLDPAAVVDLLRITYRGRRASSAVRVSALTGRDVTMASDWLLLSRAP